MLLHQYNITLRRLTLDDIEKVRYYRNLPQVSKFMEYQQHISPEMQREWFEKLNEKNDFYFMIYDNETDLGVISIYSIDWQQKTGTCGIFIWNKQYLNTDAPVRAVLVMLNHFFEVCGLAQTFIKVHRDNKKALFYNKKLGYKPLPQQDKEATFIHFSLQRKYYIEKTRHLNAFCQKTFEEKKAENIP